MFTALDVSTGSYEEDPGMGNINIKGKERVYSDILQIYKPERNHRNRISQIACYRHYVSLDVKVDDLANQLAGNQEIHAIGVVDKKGMAIGIIIRNQLFNLLARPYGRDVFKNRNVTEVMQQPRFFYHDRNILSVAEELGPRLESPEPVFFMLKTHTHEFAGIFSTITMLSYLSAITRKDIALARKLQMNMVGEDNFITTAHFDFISFTSMAKGVGGDFYLMKEIQNNQWLMVICDVSGKGIAASLITCVLSGLLHFFDEEEDLRNFISRLNTYFYGTFGPDKFVTATFALFNSGTGELQYCDMGHSFLFLLKKDKLYKVKTSNGNLPLGILPHMIPSIEKIKLAAEDSIILLTDGITEQTNPAGNPYNLKPTLRIIKQNIRSAREKICSAILNDFHSYRGSQPQDDDATFLLLYYKG